jgi:ankyrin repeat protein
MLAASSNHAPVIELLMQPGAGVTHREQTQGWTALIWAAKNGHGKSVEAMLRRGADPGLREASGRTAADWARELEHAKVPSLFSGPSGAPPQP